MATVKEILLETKLRFKTAGLDTPELDARLLLQNVLGVTHEDILLNNSRLLSESESDTLSKFILRRLNGEPVSRILGQRDFWKHSFKVSDETLDPRPDSETIIDAVISEFNCDEDLKILDLGTGTGCLLLSLLHEFPNARGVGVDISQGAIAVAKENAEVIGLANRVNFINSDWQDMPLEQNFDIVISNPPYIAEGEIAGLQPEVKNFDPYTALSGGESGLECYKTIVQILPKLLKKKGKIFFEIGYNQEELVKAILAEGGFIVLQTIADLAGHPRCTVAKWG